jgi:hypothetical protein
MLVLKARCEREIFLAPSVESQKNLYNTKFIHVFRFFSFNAAFMSIVYPLTNLENRNVLAEKFGKLYRNPGNINYRNLDLLKEDTLTCSTDLFERWAFVLKIFESYSFFCFCFTAICILIYFFCNYSVFTFARNHRRYSRLILFLDYLLIYLPKYALFPVIIQNCMYISEWFFYVLCNKHCWPCFFVLPFKPLSYLYYYFTEGVPSQLFNIPFQMNTVGKIMSVENLFVITWNCCSAHIIIAIIVVCYFYIFKLIFAISWRFFLLPAGNVVEKKKSETMLFKSFTGLMFAIYSLNYITIALLGPFQLPAYIMLF